jgi:hypothetical protein
MIGVPTTAGTGSETQSFALISDAKTHVKMACGDKKAACRIALLDPELTVTQPPRVTALTGIDALSHALETFVTSRRNPVSLAFSREAWRLLAGNLARVLENPHDLEARGSMLLGASFAGLAIENSMLGAAHALANPLTAGRASIFRPLTRVAKWQSAAAGRAGRRRAGRVCRALAGPRGAGDHTAVAWRRSAPTAADGCPSGPAVDGHV